MDDYFIYKLNVPIDTSKQRLDTYLSDSLIEHSRSQVQQWIKSGYVSVNNSLNCSGLKPNSIIYPLDQIQIKAPKPKINEKWIPQKQDNFDNWIIYEDDDLIAIDKPAGIVVYPAAGHHDNTLVNFLLSHYPQLEQLPRCGLIHRIDKDTSGILLCAKNQFSFLKLADQMANRYIKRTYLAIVFSHPNLEGSINKPIGRDSKNRKKMAVISSGKHALSYYKRLEKLSLCSIIQVNIETGRTHQIRVHFHHIGFPLVGDQVYSKRRFSKEDKKNNCFELLKSFPRQALHAQKINFKHPKTNDFIEFKSNLPDDLSSLIKEIKNMPYHY